MTDQPRGGSGSSDPTSEQNQPRGFGAFLNGGLTVIEMGQVFIIAVLVMGGVLGVLAIAASWSIKDDALDMAEIAAEEAVASELTQIVEDTLDGRANEITLSDATARALAAYVVTERRGELRAEIVEYMTGASGDPAALDEALKSQAVLGYIADALNQRAEFADTVATALARSPSDTLALGVADALVDRYRDELRGPAGPPPWRASRRPARPGPAWPGRR
jgi:hypothetical protein